jgi:hypothetical protein
MTRHKDERTITAGMMIASTTADTTTGTTMTSTAIAGHIKHGHNKHIRGTLKAGFYLYLPVCTNIILLLLRQKGDEDQLYYTATGREASASLPQTDPS